MSTAGPHDPIPGTSLNAGGNARNMPAELHLTYDHQEPLSRTRMAVAAVGAIVYHLLALAFLIFAPSAPPLRNAPQIVDLAKAIPLYVPRELTQRDPNQGAVSHELDVRSGARSAAVASVRIPPPPVPLPPAPSLVVLAPNPLPAPRVVVPNVVPTLSADAPRPEQTPKPEPRPQPESPAPSAGKAPDRPIPSEKPKLAFEPVGAAGTSPRISVDPSVKLPEVNTSIDGAVRAIAPPPSAPGSVVVGDKDASRLQLLSDPAGVDFKPYLITVLTAVRNNWLTIIPESARLGRKGRVLVQFIIDRRGHMPKIVIAEESGTAAFDRAAIDGVNRSLPFPPLPSAYSGNEIRLQLAFTYNLPSR